MRRFDDVLIVIPCLDEEAHLAPLLAAMTRDAPGALVVVADGGSNDRSRAIVAAAACHDPAIRLFDNPARLQAAGVNAAVLRYGGGRRWLVRVDAHCRYPPAYVAALIDCAARTGADAVVVPLHTGGDTCFQRAVAAAQNSWLGHGGSPHRRGGKGGFVDHGHHALMRLDAFVAAGGYAEAWACNEDAELDHRLTKAGDRLWLEPACAIDYHPRRDVAALFRQYRGHGAGRARTLRHHRLRPRLRQLLPLGVVAALALVPLAPLAWWLALPAALWLGTSLAWGIALGVRRRSACVALAGVAGGVQHLGWAIGFLSECLFGPALPSSVAPLALVPAKTERGVNHRRS